MLRVLRCILLGVAALTVAAPAAGQVRTEQLTRAQAVFPEPFTSIVGLRQLSDGRVLIADQTEKHISFLDFAAGTMREIGHHGGGPGEYDRPGALLPLPDDHTLLVDIGNMRLTDITPGGELDKESRPMMTPDGNLIRPNFTDARGRVYYSMFGITMGSGGASQPQPDSMPVFRWDPASNVTDTVATFYSPSAASGGGGTRISFGGGGSGPTLSGIQYRPFPTRDAWAVAPDGGVVVARAVGYRVDWFREGGVTSGPEIAYDPVRIDDAEKEAWADLLGNQTATFRAVGRGGGGGGGTIQMPKPDLDEVDFPDHKPPFPAGGVRTTPDGQVWVLRHQRARDESSPLFDVFDGNGRLIRRVQLPEGRRLVGFGDGVLYAVATDEDDLQWLERYLR